MKYCTKSFVHGLDGPGISKAILNAASHFDDPVALCVDGSSHDAHQHLRLLQAVDAVFVKDIFPDICFRSGMDSVMID